DGIRDATVTGVQTCALPILYVRKSDQVRAFIMECCLPDPEGSVPKQRLFQAFVLYSRGRSLPLVTDKTFFSRLPMAGVPVSSVKIGRASCRGRLCIQVLCRW